MADLLDAAASVLAETGYDAATMTQIAERAGASIGAVYQYFPNKAAVVLALRSEYARELQTHTARLEEFAAARSAEQMAHRLVDDMVQFLDTHPAFFAVLDAPVKYTGDQEARQRLRERLAGIFRSRQPDLAQEAAYRMANVAIQIIKSMNALYAAADARERIALVQEYKLVLAAYLASRLAA